MQGIVADLRDEQAALDGLLVGLTRSQWSALTPAVGWDVRDSVTHLAVIDELALECVEGRGASALADLAGADPDEVTRRQCDRGLGLEPEQMLRWWRTGRERLNDALLAVDPAARIPWGAGPMAARSFATARLMECWAHGLDCFAAVGVRPVDTARLRHVCHLAYRALPYAFAVQGRKMSAPLDELRIDVIGPHGESWQSGPATASQRITGEAGEWARVAVQRLRLADTHTLRAHGPLAQAALEVARAYV